jgi:hypothetical protein
MKTIQLDPREFILFKTLANRIHLIFEYQIKQSMYHVEADALRLDELGY